MTETWQPSTDLFPTSPKTKTRYNARLPFQAYSCWNGIAVISSSLFLSPEPIHFRRSDVEAGECAQAEVSLLCKDIWRKRDGRARISVVPGVRVAYERPVAEVVRDQEDAGVGGLVQGIESFWAKEKISWVNRCVSPLLPSFFAPELTTESDIDTQPLCLSFSDLQRRCAVTLGRRCRAREGSTFGRTSSGSTH